MGKGENFFRNLFGKYTEVNRGKGNDGITNIPSQSRDAVTESGLMGGQEGDDEVVEREGEVRSGDLDPEESLLQREEKAQNSRDEYPDHVGGVGKIGVYHRPKNTFEADTKHIEREAAGQSSKQGIGLQRDASIAGRDVGSARITHGTQQPKYKNINRGGRSKE